VRGCEAVLEFRDWGCNYWDANAKAWLANKSLSPDQWRVGKIYGGQWRDFNGTDQLRNLVHNLKFDPGSRRHLLTTYNPAELDQACLPPCHLLAQFNVDRDVLDCIVYMRSVDLCVGLPSDYILYATLLALLAKECGYTAGALTFMLGDTHVYANHVVEWHRQSSRSMHPLPTFVLDPSASVLEFKPEDIQLNDYTHHDQIKYAFNA
jgi:thymidylate synthase